MNKLYLFSRKINREVKVSVTLALCLLFIVLGQLAFGQESGIKTKGAKASLAVTNFTIGIGGTFPNITGLTGLFAAMNDTATNHIAGTVIATYISDVTEQESYFLKPGVFIGSLLIQSNGVKHTISSIVTLLNPGTLIDIHGTDNVTIDGGVNKQLTFENVFIQYQDGCKNGLITNCNFQTNVANSVPIFIGGGTALLPADITISNNNIGGIKTSPTSLPSSGIGSSSYSTIKVINNNIYNFNSTGISFPNVGNGCIISGNSLYMEKGVNVPFAQVAISVVDGTGHSIMDNFIGGQSPNCGGNPLSTSFFTGIAMSSKVPGVSTIQRNTIQNISISAFNSGNTFVGVSVGRGLSPYDVNIRKNKIFNILGFSRAEGIRISNQTSITNEISNNMISLGDVSSPFGASIYGIRVFSFFNIGGSYDFFYNSINIYGTESSGNSSYAFADEGPNNTCTVKDNIFLNVRTNLQFSGIHYAISYSPSSSYTSDYNDLYVSGPFLGSNKGSNQANLAAWQTAVTPNIDLNSFNVLPVFVNDITDLHIISNATLANKGTPIVSVPDDIDGVTRTGQTNMGINQFGGFPGVYNVTGGGTYCQGLGGLPVGLANSDLGVAYTLFNGITQQGSPLTGTGSAITFGNQLAGIYTVSGSIIPGGTLFAMTGSATIIENPAPLAPPASATQQPTCSVATGTITITPPLGVGLTYSIDGLTYTNNTGIFTLLTPNTYSVTAKNLSGCISSLATLVTINAQPTAPIWTGAVGQDWNTAGNWCPNKVPIATDNVTIPIVPNEPTISMSAVCNNLTIESGAVLTIAATGALTANGSLINNNTATSGIVIQSNATNTGQLMIGLNADAGTVSADRFMTATGWHMVSSPLSMQTVLDFISLNTLKLSTAATSSNRGMMDYNSANNIWYPFFTTGAGNGSLGAGKGFSMHVTPDAAVTFKGALQTGPQPVTTLAGFWNCVGNPYTSAIGINISGGSGSVNNFLTVNTSIASPNLDPSFGAVYVWEQPDANNVTGQYTIISNTPVGVAPFDAQQGQAFLVKMNTAATSVSFTPAMQFINPAVAFKSSVVAWPNIKLEATVGIQKSSTYIAFNSAMTKGLDPTYDAGLLKGADLLVYSKLVEDNGIPFAIQALPDNDYSNLIIPIGLDFKTGGEVVFSSELMNLPLNCKVILEDKLTNTFTDLNTGVYRTTIASNSVITDRFRLKLSSTTTGLDKDPVVGKLNAYAIRNVEIRVTGKVNKNAVATLYDVHGRIVLVKNLQDGSENIIPLPNIKIGIYILSVTDNGKLNRFKILIRE